MAQRTVTDQLYRYEELLALHLADSERLEERLREQKQVILSLDGLQPDVGHEVLGGLRDCCSGEVLVARTLLVDDNGNTLSHILAQRPYKRTISSEGEVSVDPDVLVAIVEQTIDDALNFAGPLVKHIGAVALDTFWHSSIPDGCSIVYCILAPTP